MDAQKTKLGLEETPEVFLERTCSGVRKESQTKIGELLPATSFVVWGSPLSLIQESINVLRKCTMQVSASSENDGYPRSLQNKTN